MLAVAEEMKTRDHEVRDALVAVLGGKNVAQLADVAARDSLKLELRSRVGGLFAPGGVKKVYFPREILPLSTVGVALVDFVLQSAVLLLYLLASGYEVRERAAFQGLEVQTPPVLHFASVPLPADRGDFGSGNQNMTGFEIGEEERAANEIVRGFVNDAGFPTGVDREH